MVRFRRPVFVPVILTIGATVWGITDDSWAFAAIPFVVIGSFSATPNGNLIDGCLAYLFMAVSLPLLFYVHPDLAASMFCGTALGFYSGIIETWLTSSRIDV